MSTLLVRLAGPMQSWGTQSRFKVRDTEREPSKSGVIGLLCAALGRCRPASVDDLAALRMGVRVDFPGVLQRDYHTAGGAHRQGEKYGVVKADGSRGDPVESWRYYLSDADFLVGLEGGLEALRALEAAIRAPVWQIFLGRKAFVASVPAHIPGGLLEDRSLEAALLSHPWPAVGRPIPPPARRPTQLLLVLEAEATRGAEIRRDQPVGAAFQTRRFALRHVATRPVRLHDEVPVREE